MLEDVPTAAHARESVLAHAAVEVARHDPVDPATVANPDAVLHVNETGFFANGKGAFRHASGRFNSQGPFGPGVRLPAEITPGTNDGWFWIGQYVGMICDVEDSQNDLQR